MKLLVDECLSEELVGIARGRGHVASSHVRWIGKGGSKDWELMAIILADDWTFVTKNSIDFRGRAEKPGRSGHYREASVHAGLVCLNGPVGMDLDMQKELFEVALDVLDDDHDLVNQALEVTLEDATATTVKIVRYALPIER